MNDNEQRTQEWFQARLGHITGSRAKKVYGTPETVKKFARELIAEKLTGESENTYTTPAMSRGTAMEDEALAQYEMISGDIVTSTGFVEYEDMPQMGASPDGLINDDGVLEIKNPNTATHIEYLTSQKFMTDYKYQMLHEIICTKRKYAVFFSYDNRIADIKLQTLIHLYEPTPEEIEQHLEKCRKVVELMQKYEEQLRNILSGA